MVAYLGSHKKARDSVLFSCPFSPIRQKRPFFWLTTPYFPLMDVFLSLKEHDPDKYTSMLFEGTLKEYLLTENERISGRIWDLTQELAKQNDINERQSLIQKLHSDLSINPDMRTVDSIGGVNT